MNTNEDNYGTSTENGADEGRFTTMDILNMPADKAIAELAKFGAKTVYNIKQTTSEIFQKISDDEYSKICRPVITMDECLNWLKSQRTAYPQGAYFFIYAERNSQPRNENDLFSVAIALVDGNKKAIPVNARRRGTLFSDRIKNQDIVCMVIPAKTLDTKLLKALNGGPSVLIKL